MLRGKRVPSWIAEISEEGDREKAINKLSVNDVFRSQFRSPKNAAPSQIEIISWGLDHLNRLRKGFIEARGERWRFFREIVVPIATVLVAIAALTSSALVQMTSMRGQAELKKFEVLTRPKQDAYGRFMNTLIATFGSAYDGNLELVRRNADSLEGTFYSLEPFLTNTERTAVWDQVVQFNGMCVNLAKEPASETDKRTKYLDSFLRYKQGFRDRLFDSLFR